MGQRDNDLGWLQPRRVIGVEVGEHYEASAIEDVGGRYRQHPTFRPGLRRIEVAERQVSGPELLRHGEGDAIAHGDFASRILQYRKRWFALAALRERPISSLRRERNQGCAQALYFRVGRRKRLQFENAKGTPVAPEKADDNGTTTKKIRKADETTALGSKPEQGRRLAGLCGLSGDARFGERLYRAPHGINHVWFGVCLVFGTARFKQRLQRHGAAPGSDADT